MIWDRDKYITKLLRRHGWIVLRFWENDIMKNIRYCLNKITKALDKRKDDAKTEDNKSTENDNE